MGMETWIVIGIIVLIVALAAGYVIRAKKRGKACIGCPGNCTGCTCGCQQETK